MKNLLKKFVFVSLLAIPWLAQASTFTGYAHIDNATGQVLSSEMPSVNPVTSVSGINLKSTGQTTLYTVPNGKTFYPTELIMVATTADTVAVAPIIRIGKASGYAEWLPLTTLTALGTTNQFINLSSATTLLVHQSFAAGEVIKLDVQTGATATTLTATVYIFGFLI